MEDNKLITLLQLRYPDVHNECIREFEQVGLHSYDIKADVLESKVHDTDNKDDITIRIRFGEAFTEYEELPLKIDVVSPDNEAILQFFRKCAQIAHKTLKDEYRESMNSERRRKQIHQNGR